MDKFECFGCEELAAPIAGYYCQQCLSDRAETERWYRENPDADIFGYGDWSSDLHVD